ncbi:MAG: folate-binding protein YgfZ [Robiginitomaculum sp.]|nr:folate-binding protein YgfZ [Robiginitomaculum sp.]
MPIAKLNRTLISLTGDTVEDFIGGLITNNLGADITFAALLTPQGKIIADFFVHKTDNGLVLDTPVKFGKTLIMRLKMYKLRAAIDIEDISDDFFIYALWDGKGDIGKPDPRHIELGQRFLTGDLLSTEHTEEDYDSHRLSLGIPDSTWDFDTVQTFPADANMDLLSGVDYKKGCFIGQEVVSRMHRKTSVRKRMCGVKLSGPAQSGDDILAGDIKIGTLNHVRSDHGMALIRLDRLAKTDQTPTVGGNPATIMEPNYDTDKS